MSRGSEPVRRAVAVLHALAVSDIRMRYGRGRLRALKWLLDPQLRGQHLKRWTLVGMVRSDLSDRGVPWVRMLLRRGRASSALNLAWRHRVTALLHAGTAGAAVSGRRRLAGGLLLGAVLLNRDFYALLLRCGGLRLGGAGVLLHLVHHLTAAASVPVAVAGHVVEAVRSNR